MDTGAPFSNVGNFDNDFCIEYLVYNEKYYKVENVLLL